jgi:chromosome segregation protein
VVFEAGRGEADQSRVKADAPGQAVNAGSRMADLRHVEADLETMRQAHYAAGDQVNQAQGLLYEASAEVGRLEAEIRFVVEGRQRAEQRLASCKEQIAQWARKEMPRPSSNDWPSRGFVGRRTKAELLAAQVEEQAHAAAGPGRRAAAAQAAANDQRGSVMQVQQQIQVLAAEQPQHRRAERASCGARRERLAAERNAWPRPTRPAGKPAQSQLRRRPRGSGGRRPPARTAGAGAALDETAPQAPAGRQPRVGRLADLSARLEALRALQEKVQTEGKLKPWLAKHGLDGLQGLWTQVHIEPGWETRWKRRCASA